MTSSYITKLSFIQFETYNYDDIFCMRAGAIAPSLAEMHRYIKKLLSLLYVSNWINDDFVVKFKVVHNELIVHLLYL